MPFKIVQTRENNKNTLFVVPSEWEDQNKLKWPRKYLNQHIRNELSTPEADWKQMGCVLKRENIPTYETAEYVLAEMLNHTDTEDETNHLQQKHFHKSVQELDINILADEIICPAKSVVSTEIVTDPFTYQISDDTHYHLTDNEVNSNQNQCCADNAAQNLTILSNQTLILEQLNSITNIQNTLLQKIALFSVQLEDAVLQINSHSNVTELQAVKNTLSNTAFCIEAVENLLQLNTLENKLSDCKTREQLKTSLSVICPAGKGIDCAYRLADILFTRDFLCQCSWSGGSRGDDVVKIAWKSFKNVLSFFFEMIYSWDKTYTMKENETFFKNILKNAKKRKLAKNQRASTSRLRAKRSRLQTANDDVTTDEDEFEQENEENPIINNSREAIDQNREEEKKNKDVDKENITNNIEEKKNVGKETEVENDFVEKNDININNSSISNKDNIKEERKVQQVVKEQNNLEKTTTGFEENKELEKKIEEKDRTAIKGIEKEHDIAKISKDSNEEVSSEEKNKNTDEEAKNKSKSNDPNTSTSSNKVEKRNLKMKVAKLSKMKGDKKRLIKIIKNRQIPKNVAKVTFEKS